MFGQSLDNHAYIPLPLSESCLAAARACNCTARPKIAKQFLATIEQARIAMRNRHKLKGNEEDDFGLVNVEQVNNQIDQITGAIAGVVVPITFISLLVGGIVVMNMMLFSVTERTFEIGLRKAVGAKGKHILMQFLIESSLLSAFGGLLGLLLAAGIASLISVTTPVPMTITVPYIVLSLGVSGGIGMLFGIYPGDKSLAHGPDPCADKA